MDLSSKCRNFVLDGLTHFTEVCIRLSKYEVAKNVCTKILTELPTDYHKPFEFKMIKIESFNGTDSEDTNAMDKNTETLLGARLVEALNRKK